MLHPLPNFQAFVYNKFVVNDSNFSLSKIFSKIEKLLNKQNKSISFTWVNKGHNKDSTLDIEVCKKINSTKDLKNSVFFSSVILKHAPK